MGLDLERNELGNVSLEFTTRDESGSQNGVTCGGNKKHDCKESTKVHFSTPNNETDTISLIKVL